MPRISEVAADKMLAYLAAPRTLKPTTIAVSQDGMYIDSLLTRHASSHLYKAHATVRCRYHCLRLNRTFSKNQQSGAKTLTSTKLATLPSSSTPRVLNLAPARFQPKRLIKPRCTFLPSLAIPDVPIGTTPVKPWMTGTSMRSASSRSRHD